jgi:predicted  nucleic acid-binding Zn-ribbon protein
MFTIDNAKLYKLIEDKDTLVKQGRKISSELETIEFKINKLQDKEKVITGKHENKDLATRGEIARLEMERAMKAFDKVAAEIHADKLEAIPKTMKDEHYAFMKKREELERDRNKIALKIQKFKDKLIPMLKKEIKPHLKEFEDTQTVELKDGKVVVETFDYLEDYKARFRSKKR